MLLLRFRCCIGSTIHRPECVAYSILDAYIA